jgi:hypothetical protein
MGIEYCIKLQINHILKDIEWHSKLDGILN